MPEVRRTAEVPRPAEAGPAAGGAPRAPSPWVLVVGEDGAFAEPGVATTATALGRYLARTADPAGPGGVRVLARPRPGRGPLPRGAAFTVRILTARHRDPPDVVVAVVPGAAGALAAALVARRHAARLLLVVHDLPAGDPGRRARRRARRERYALRRADRVAVGSAVLAAAVRALGVPADRITVVPGLAGPARVVDRATARRRTGHPAAGFVVTAPAPARDPSAGFPGLETVLAAAARWRPHTELVLLAAPGQAGPIAARAAGLPGVRVTDPADDDARALVLAAADVLLVGGPGPAGAPPDLLLECFRAGRPVVAAVGAAGPGAHEITLSRGAGLVVRPGDPQVMADAVRALRADPALRRAMGGAARGYARAALDGPSPLGGLAALVDALAAG